MSKMSKAKVTSAHWACFEMNLDKSFMLIAESSGHVYENSFLISGVVVVHYEKCQQHWDEKMPRSLWLMCLSNSSHIPWAWNTKPEKSDLSILENQKLFLYHFHGKIRSFSTQKRRVIKQQFGMILLACSNSQYLFCSSFCLDLKHSILRENSIFI